MLDLNATIFYKVKFTISAANIADDLLWKIILHIKNWQSAKWNTKDRQILTIQNRTWTNLKKGSRIFSSGNDPSVYIESEYFAADPTKQYWACSITEKKSPQSGYAPRQWVTEIGYEQEEKNMATFSCVLSYSDQPGFIGLYEEPPVSSIPNLIKNLLLDKSIRCFNGSDMVSSTPNKLESGSWPQFWNRLTDPKREIPYIYISPSRLDYLSEETKLLIDPVKLATVICGNALVFYADSLHFSSEMQYDCPDGYSCYGGAIRIYLPHIETDSETDPYRHRYLSAAFMKEHGADYILQILRRALAQNVNFYDSFFRVDECRQQKENFLRYKRMIEIQAQHQAQLVQVENQTIDIALEEEERRLQAEELVKVFKAQVDEYKQDNFNLSAQVENYRVAVSRNAELERALKNRFEISSLPNTPLKVMDYFSRIFGDRIAFTDGAIKSAKNCTLEASELWRIFYALVTTMRELFISGNSNPFTEFKLKTGIDCARGEGTMTRKDKNLMKQFEAEYFNTIVDIEPHITFPREEQSIHFGFSNIDQKIVIGRCGEHLEIYSSQKRR